MSAETPAAERSTFSGKMFLFSAPELLNARDHGNLGLNTSATPLAFSRSAQFIPLASVEMVSAQRHYPIVFSSHTDPTPLAIVSIMKSDNLFVDSEGNWDASSYVPGYLRCHPFALATRDDNQYSVVIDRNAASVGTEPEQPFFDGPNLSAEIQKKVDFCSQYYSYSRGTKDFCQKLKDLNLLNGQKATFEIGDSGEQVSTGTYIAVDMKRVQELDAGTLRELHADGTLAAIYAHWFSLDNWNGLLERYKSRNEKGS